MREQHSTISQGIHLYQTSMGLEAGSLDVGKESSFFELGGSSMLAGTLASKVRKHFRLAFTAEDVFIQGTLSGMADLLVERGYADSELDNNSCFSCLPGIGDGSSGGDDIDALKGINTMSSTSCTSLIVPWIPVLFFIPIFKVCRWTLYASLWLMFMNKYDMPRFWALLCSLLITWVAKNTLQPLLLIILKWFVMGRYREGK